ncbi:MAG: xanthine dehydrogenase family protein subunit M [Alphaproteobacteria bacterium]|nr:xanthine dehydrogenase family protein subunit M [Alphaproteobacteria bacterium]
MKAVDFDYEQPRSVAETCRLLGETGREARLLAGGQTLAPLLAMRLARPAVVIDINRIEEFQGIDAEAESVVIRACTRQSRALADPIVQSRLPLLAKALSFVGHVQTRNRGTIGGSLANADPSAEIGLAALALDAEIEARSATASRRIPIGDFFISPMVTALAPDECLTVVRFPLPQGAVGTGFREASIRRSDFALAAVAVQLVLERGVCRSLAVSLGGAGATPVKLTAIEHKLLDTRLGDAELAEAGRLAHDAIDAVSDIHASAAHRRRIAGALTMRAIAEARDEALAGRA